MEVPEHVVVASDDGMSDVRAADVDGDGWVDLVFAASGTNKIGWYRWDSAVGAFEAEQRVVTTSATGVVSVFAADLDGDGDLDLASASEYDVKISWYENTDGAGSFGPQQVVTRSADRARSVFAADLDGDGDMDLASASYNDDKIAWYENTDGAGSFGPQQVVTVSADGAYSVFAADLDGDGDMDLASASYNNDKIAWYENVDGAGTFGPQQVVTALAGGARSVFAADLDGDGDMDLASASWLDNKIAWYENADGAGSFGPQQVVTTSANGAWMVFSADLDGDGDMDLASASNWDNTIAWYENADGVGTFGPRQVVTTLAKGANTVIAADLDGDGDVDLASASYFDDKIAWYANADGAGAFGSQEVVTSSASGASSVFAADLDGDGDMDLASASSWDDKIAWYENVDGAGSFGPQQVVTTSADRASSVFAADLDGDGDIDLASASEGDDKIAWYENLYGNGTFGPQQVVTTLANGASSVFAADLDGDGDLDLASASISDNKIAWYENTDGAGSFGPQQVATTLTNEPQSVFAADLDGDGDLDLASASSDDDKIAWYENTDGAGSFGPQRVVTALASGAFSVFAADLDGDGDMDLASASQYDDEIAWYENTDGAGSFGPQKVVTTSANGASSVFAADLDSDGDLDLASASRDDGKIAWYENTDGAGTFGPQQVVTTSAGSAMSVFAADLDGDGDLNLASASFNNGKIAWYENTDRSFSLGLQHEVTTLADGAGSVFAADLDGDGDMDLASASVWDDKIAWYQNLDGVGTYGPQIVVTTLADGAKSVFAADLDGDGDMDLASASSNDDKIAWYENTDGAGTFGPPRVVTRIADRAQSVLAADLDGDGDMDLVSASYSDIAWYENVDGAGAFGLPVVITSANGAWSVFAADLDGDGDLDLASASYDDVKISWYENTDGAGSFGPQQLVSTSVIMARSVFVADLDGDGDMDLASASRDDDKIAWYENTDGAGSFGPQRVVTTSASWAVSVFAADLDGDGDMDLASASSNDNKIAWYENTDGAGSFGPQQVVTTSADSAESVFAADIDGDGDVDLVSASASDDTVAWFSNVARSPFHTYAPSQVSPPSSLECSRTPVPFTCLASALQATSRCVRDTVVLEPGVYACPRDRHYFVTHAVHLAARVPGTVTFDCGGNKPLFYTSPHPAYASAGLVGNLELDGITIANGGGAQASRTGTSVLHVSGQGSRLALTSAVLLNCTARPNPDVSMTHEGFGGAVLATGGASLDVVNTRFAGCSATDGAGAVHLIGGSAQIVGSQFVGNTASGAGGGALACDRAPSRLTISGGSVFTDNVADRSSGGAVLVLEGAEASNITVTDTRFAGNSAGLSGGAFAVAGVGSTSVTCGSGCVVEGNTAVSQVGSTVAAVTSNVELEALTSPSSASRFRDSSAVRVVFGPGSTLEVGGSDAADAFVCGPTLDLVGATIVGGAPTPTLRVHECALTGSDPPAPPASWVATAPSTQTVHTTQPVSLDGSLPPQIMSGHPLSSTVIPLDAYGQRVVDPSLAITVLVRSAAQASVRLSRSRLEIQGGTFELRSLAVAGDLRVLSYSPDGIPVTMTLQIDGPAHAQPPTASYALAVVPCAPDYGAVADEDETHLTCARCPPGSHSNATSSTFPCVALGCFVNAVRNASGVCECDVGFWSAGRGVDVACQPCPLGAVCPGATTPPYAQPGFASTKDEAIFLLCRRSPSDARRVCLGRNTCATGYTSRLCSACVDGYFASISGDCKACKGTTGLAPLVATLAITAAFLLVLFTLLLGRTTAIRVRARSFTEITGRESCHALRQAARWAVRLWRELFLLAAELAVLVAFVVVGLRETFEVLIMVVGFLALFVWLALERIQLYHNSATDARKHHVDVALVPMAAGGADGGFKTGYVAFRDDDSCDSCEYSSDDEWLDEQEERSESVSGLAKSRVVEMVVKTAVVYVQTLGAMLSVYEAEWSAVMRGLGATLKKTTLQVTGLECNGLSYAGQFYLALGLYPGTLAVLAVAFGVAWVLFQRERSSMSGAGVSTAAAAANAASFSRRAGALRTMSLKIGLSMGYFFLFSVCAKSFAVFACNAPYPGAGVSFLDGAPWIQCWTGVHARMVTVAVLALVLVAAGVAAVAVAVAGGVSPGLEFLYAGYTPRAWWFEGAILGRRVLFALFASALPRGSVVSGSLLQGVLLTSLLLLFAYRPFKSSVAQQLEVATTFAATASLMVVQNMSLTSNEGTLTLLSAVFVLGNGAMMLALVVAAAVPVWAVLRRKHSYLNQQ